MGNTKWSFNFLSVLELGGSQQVTYSYKNVASHSIQTLDLVSFLFFSAKFFHNSNVRFEQRMV